MAFFYVDISDLEPACAVGAGGGFGEGGMGGRFGAAVAGDLDGGV